MFPFGEVICNPFLVLYGTALPKYFYGALEERVLENGLIPRTIIVDADIPRNVVTLLILLLLKP